MSYFPFGNGEIIKEVAYSSLPAAAQKGRLIKCTDAPFEYFDTGAALHPKGVTFPLTTPPLVAAFTAVNAGGRTTTNTDSKGGTLMSLADGINGRDWRLLKKTAPSAPYTLTVQLFPQLNASNYPVSGIAWRLASNGYISNLVVYCDSTGTCYMQENDETANNNTTSPTFTNSATTTVAFNGYQAGAGVWLRLQDDNTNRYFMYSIDGMNFRNFKTSVARANFFGSAPDEIAFLIGNGPGANTSNACFFSSWATA